MRREAKLNWNRFWVLVWSIFLLAVAVVVVVAMMSQRQTKSGSNPEEVKVQSLTCESDNVIYPFLKYDNSVQKNLKIIATFDGDKIDTISLTQMLYYADEETVIQSEGENHAGMNMSFGENGLEADALEANYAKLKDGLRFGIYGVYDKMTEAEMQYFLLNNGKERTYNDVKLTYEGLGMICVGDSL